MEYQILDPVVQPFQPEGRLASRLETLEGKRIGLYSNGKIKTAELLDECETVLRRRHGIVGTQRGRYSPAQLMRSEEWGDIDGCDAVILTHGD
jgi:hypothetical protein